MNNTAVNQREIRKWLDAIVCLTLWFGGAWLCGYAGWIWNDSEPLSLLLVCIGGGSMLFARFKRWRFQQP